MSINIQELTEKKTSESYPNITINNPNDAVVVVIKRTLEKGDMQVIINLNGTRKVVNRISPSAYNIDKLLRVLGKLDYVIGPNAVMTITSVEEYLTCIT